jgi:hypothetical protein
MGSVWEARHRATPVALKFLATPDPAARALFAEEARAHASLRHPHILDVLDIGAIETPGPTAELRAGTPWIALELASGGTVRRLADQLDWAGTRVVLLAIFVQVTLDNPVHAPLLFVLDLGDATLAGRHAEVLERLQANDRTRTVQLGPLSEIEAGALVRHQLPLTRTVLTQLVRQTGGWPGRIAARLRDLAQSDALVAGPHGFELAPGRSLTEPSAATSTGRSDLARLLAALPERAWTALLRAAVLGSEVQVEEWIRVCDDPDGTAPSHAIPLRATRTRQDLLDRMIRCGFAEEGPEHTWHFVQPALRDAILEQGRADGTIAAAHADVARFLDADPARPRRHHRRIAHHRAAGSLESAFSAAVDAIASDIGNRLDHVASARSLLHVLELPPDDARRGFIDAWHLRLLHSSDVDELKSRATTLLADAHRHGWPVSSHEPITVSGSRSQPAHSAQLARSR